MFLFCCNFGLLLVKTKGIPSNALTGSTTSQSLDDLVHVSGPITEDAIIKVLQQRSALGENYVSIINRLYFYLFLVLFLSSLLVNCTVSYFYNFILSCFQTRLGPVLIAVNSFDRIQSKVGPKHNQHLQRVIQTVTRKLAASSTPQVIVLR